MRRLAVLVAVLAAVPGCSGGQSDASRMATGSMAMVVKGPAGYDYDVTRLEVVGEIGPYLSLGTRVRVVDDSEKPGSDYRGRAVLVHVEDGEFKGRAGKLTRWELRPE